MDGANSKNHKALLYIWWWGKNFRKICGKNYFGVVQLKNPKGQFWDMMVNGREQKNLRKICGKKTTLGWFKLKISSFCFGCGGEWL